MHRSLRAALAALVLGSGLIGQAPRAGIPAARASSPLRDRIFAGLLGGGVYVSGDGGGSWQEADAGLPTGVDVASLAVAPGGRTLYAGTNGAGVYVSGDDGRSWHGDNAGDRLLRGAQVLSVLVSPANGRLVYAALGDGHVGRSDDGGAHWRLSLPPIRSVLTALALDEGRPSTLLAGTNGEGLLLSIDAGASWSAPAANIPLAAGVYAFATSPTNPDVIYAATGFGVYQSVNGGATWQHESRGISDDLLMRSIAVDPLNSAHVVAGGGGSGTIYRSLDGGSSWIHPAGRFHLPAADALLYDPARPGTVLAGLAGEDGTSDLALSTDQGASWPVADAIPRFAGAAVLCLALSLRAASPTDPVNPPVGGQRGMQYVAQTGHTVRGSFYAFYRRYGDLKIFGLPLTEAYTDHGQVVQYFERAELTLTAYGVGEAPLGSLFTAGRAFPPASPSPPPRAATSPSPATRSRGAS